MGGMVGCWWVEWWDVGGWNGGMWVGGMVGCGWVDELINDGQIDEGWMKDG